MTAVDRSAPVLVTGASGYLASWIVRYLLEDGRTVRGTVRDPDKPTGLEHLHKVADDHPGRLTLHRADLLDKGSFDDAVAGCELVMHTASPFLVGKLHDPDEQVVRPALDGTRNVLGSVDRADSVKRVVLTSSASAIYGNNADMEGKRCFTEDDWNTTSSLKDEPYAYAKTTAEREAWALSERQARWDLITIQPGLVVGPALTTASESGSLNTMKPFGDFSLVAGAPPLTVGVVDVRDVARAHILAGDVAAAHGRYIVNGDHLSFLDIGRTLRRRFGRRYPFPYNELPKVLLKLAAPAAGMTRGFVDRNFGLPLCLDSTRSRSELGLTYRPSEQTLVEHFQQMLDDGVVRRR